MGSDLTYHANAWPGYDNPCVACGAGCRAIDRFCSQCGQPDPLGPREEPSYDDDELARSPTVVAMDADELRPDATNLQLEQAATAISGPQTTTRARGRNTEAALALERMLIPGNVFGRRYRIQRFLGAGAMGYVCSAIDNTIDETVALKILSAPVQEDPEGFERLGGDALPLMDEPEEDVLRSDVIVVEQAGLLLGEDDDPPGSIGEALEHVPASCLIHRAPGDRGSAVGVGRFLVFGTWPDAG